MMSRTFGPPGNGGSSTMKKVIAAAVMLSTFAAVAAVAATPAAQEDHQAVVFLPKNNMKIPVGDVRAKGIDEATFNSVMDRIEQVYGPIIAQHGGQLVVNRLWTDDTVNASAEQQGDQWIIN